VSNRAYKVIAKYGDTCPHCEKGIRPGDHVIADGQDQWLHADCFMESYATRPRGGYHGPQIVDYTR
jgi:hypothetical protein